jgi:ankyrin repeat protein
MAILDLFDYRNLDEASFMEMGKFVMKIRPKNIDDECKEVFERIRRYFDTTIPEFWESARLTISYDHCDADELEGLLRTASEFGQIDKVRQLLCYPKVNVNATDSDTGKSALHFAVEKEFIEVITYLFEHGANSAQRDAKSETPLHETTGVHNKELFDILLRRGCDFRLADKKGLTPVHTAVMQGNKPGLDFFKRVH